MWGPAFLYSVVSIVSLVLGFIHCVTFGFYRMTLDVIKHWIVCVFLVNCYVGFQFMCYAVTITVVPGVVLGAACVVVGRCQSYIGVWWVHVL